MKRGIDVSRYDKGLSLRVAKSRGYDFVIIRDGWGTGNVDPCFAQFVQDAQTVGMDITGIYHWIDGRSVDDAKKNAKNAIENLEAAGLPKDTVIWCDLEFTEAQQKERGLSYADLKAMTMAFCDYCLKKGYPTGVYTNQAYLKYVYGDNFGNFYDIWLADYEGSAGYKCVYRQTGIDSMCGINVDVNEFYGQYTAGTAKPQSSGGETSMRYIKKLIPAKTYVDGAKKLLKRKLEYRNRAPYNLGYCHEDMHISGDCWCINPKVMVWSISINQPVWENYVVDKYYYTDGIEASGLPDWDGGSIMDAYCDDITFKKMLSQNIAPALLLNADRTHMGAYIGEFEIDGKTYNVCEFTPANGISPRMSSYVDESGRRMTHKGGTVVSYWNRAGKMTGIIDYSGGGGGSEDKPKPDKPWSIDNVAVYIMRGSLPDGTPIPNGTDKRKDFFAQYGYTASEVQKAQDIVNHVYAEHNMDVLSADLAMEFISGAAGDGVTARRDWIAENYPDYDTEKLFRATQDKVNLYLG